MECNREEAIKAKELAIQKFSENEYSAAKKLALKAQSMCPELEDIEQLLLVLDVFLASEVKIGGETDWYEVLGVSTSSDEATIRKQYKVKALALHPDKNKSVDSTDAFRLMAKAYEILSDRNLRAVHDEKRRCSQVEATNTPRSDNSRNPNPKSSARKRRAGRRSERAGVFWTYCISCSRYLRYREIFRGHVLLCKCCKSPLVANPVASPPGEPNTSHRARRNLRRTAAPEEPRDGPSGSNPLPKPGYFHHQQGFTDPSRAWAHQGFSDPSFGWSWAHEGFSSHGNPGSSSQRPMNDAHGFAQDSSWAHFYHHQAQQQWDPRGPAQGSAWVPPPQFFSAQMNMGSGSSFYDWPGSNVNLNVNFDFSFASNDPSATSRKDEINSMKRTFETTEGAIDGREEARGDSNKKRDVREGCHLFGANFSNDNNHGDDGDDRNRGDSSTKPSGLRIR